MNSTFTAKTNTLKDIESECDYGGSCNTSETGIASLEANLVTDTDIDTDNDNNYIEKVNYLQLLRDKEHELRLTLQSVQLLHSELKRLKQSEAWYRDELRHNKSKQLVNLEKHYNQERQHVQENQRLQRECLRLCTKCDKLENELLTQRKNALQQLKQQNIKISTAADLANEHECQQLENFQQNALIAEQQLLINVLRRQKQTLLQELQQLTKQKDDELLLWQGNMARKEVEQHSLSVHCQEMQKLQETVAQLQEQVEMQNKLMLENEQHETTADNVDQSSMIEDKQQCEAYELIELNARYADLCALYENSRLELELQQDDEDDHEKQVKLQEYALEIKKLKERIIILELVIDETRDNVEKDNKNDMCQNETSSNQLINEIDEAKDMQDIFRCGEQLQISIEKHKELFCVKKLFLEQLKDKREEQEMEFKLAERLTLLQKLSVQQTNKIEILQKAKNDWEIVQTQLQETKRLTDENAHELAEKSIELEQLNSLFKEQNVELQQLHVQQMKLAAQDAIHKRAAAEEIALLKRQLKESLERQQRLQEDMNRDSATKIMQHRQQMRTFKMQVQQLLQVRDEQQTRLLHLERELKRHKRRALLIPEPIESNNLEITTASAAEMARNVKSFDAQINDRLRILSKVLEAEHARQMQRYNLHIRSLLRHVKDLKKSLYAAENKLHEQSAISQEAMVQLQAQLQDMRFKHSQSQQTISTLQQALKKERRDFIAESSTSQFTVDSTENLIDDMKNLIEQSAAATRRPSTQTVLQLIQRSEQCVPKLQKLEYAVEQLCNDVQTIVNAPKTVNSLFDELQVASESKCQTVI